MADGYLDKLLAALRKYRDTSAMALGRAPSDIGQYWNSLPAASPEQATFPQKAVEGTNYAIDAAMRGVSGGRWKLERALAAAGLPASELQSGIEAFGRRNAPLFQTAADIGEVSAGMMGTPALSRAAIMAEADRILASKMIPGYNPTPKPPRPFEADYPKGAEADVLGKLLRDIEGRRLRSSDETFARGTDETSNGPLLIGRGVLGGQDETIPQTQAAYDALAKALTGSISQRVAPREIGGDPGRLKKIVDWKTGQPSYEVFLSNKLTEKQALRTHAHELGHAIDELAGQIPTEGLVKELEFVYNALATGQERTRNLTRPKDIGYRPAEVPREMMAEAIRAYMADPNYIKTVAPRTAAAIRAAVNENPRLNKKIQFNVLAPLMAAPMMKEGEDNYGE